MPKKGKKSEWPDKILRVEPSVYEIKTPTGRKATAVRYVAVGETKEGKRVRVRITSTQAFRMSESGIPMVHK